MRNCNVKSSWKSSYTSFDFVNSKFSVQTRWSSKMEANQNERILYAVFENEMKNESVLFSQNNSHI